MSSARGRQQALVQIRDHGQLCHRPRGMWRAVQARPGCQSAKALRLGGIGHV